MVDILREWRLELVIAHTATRLACYRMQFQQWFINKRKLIIIIELKTNLKQPLSNLVLYWLDVQEKK
jgi:hypothetical protein